MKSDKNRMNDILGDLGARQSSGAESTGGIPAEIREAAKAAGIPAHIIDNIPDEAIKRAESGMGQRSLYDALLKSENDGEHAAIITPDGPMTKTQFLMKVLKRYSGMLWSGTLGLAHSGLQAQKEGYPFYILSDDKDGTSIQAGEEVITQAEQMLESMVDEILDGSEQDQDVLKKRIEDTLIDHSIMMLKKSIAALEQVKKNNP